MCINTDISLMIIFSIRAPNSFEMKYVKIHVRLKFFDQFNRKLSLVMSKRTEFSIIALAGTAQIRGTKFRLVFVWMIELFDSIVRFITTLAIRALLMVVYIPAFLRLVKS